MKTIHELYKEIMASKELKDQFIESAKAGKQEEFLKAHGCEVQNAAGGECNAKTRTEVVDSIFSVGIACMIKAIESARSGKHLGQQSAGEGRICNND